MLWQSKKNLINFVSRLILRTLRVQYDIHHDADVCTIRLAMIKSRIVKKIG